MEYRFSDILKHILPANCFPRDSEDENTFGKIIAALMLVAPLVIAPLVTVIAALACGESVLFTVLLSIFCVLVWVVAFVTMAAAVILLKEFYNPQRPTEIRIVRRRRKAVPYQEWLRTGKKSTIEEDAVYLNGKSQFFPTAAKVPLGEDGAEYSAVADDEGNAHPVCITQADAYVWEE